MLMPVTLIALLGFASLVLCSDEDPQKDNTADIQKLNEENKPQLSRERRSSDSSQLALALGSVQHDIPLKNIYAENPFPAVLDNGIFDIPVDEIVPKDPIASDNVDLSIPESLAIIVDGLTKAPQATRTKRSWFHSWAGKRSAPDDGDTETEVTGADKRARFHSWSGKRAVGSLTNLANDNINKRPAFHAWSGKRALSNDEGPTSGGEIEVSSLEDWMTKALLDIASNDGTDKVGDALMVDDSGAEQRAKRPRFHSWSGKRSTQQAGPGADSKSSLDNVYVGDETLREHLAYLERRRNILTYLNTIYKALLGTDIGPLDTSLDETKIPVPKEANSQIDSQQTGIAANMQLRPLEKKKKTRSRKRPSFHSWAGKRSSLGTHLRYRRSAQTENGKSIEKESETSKVKVNSSLDSTLNKTQVETIAAGSKLPNNADDHVDDHKLINSASSKPTNDRNEKISISKRGSSVSNSFTVLPGSQVYDFTNNLPGQTELAPPIKGFQEVEYPSQTMYIPTSRDFSDPPELSYIIEEDGQAKYPDEVVEVVPFVSDPIPHGQWVGNDYNEQFKRGAFHAWSGKKRSYENDDVLDADKRPAFHSWSGKRDGFSEMSKRPAFHSWSGRKRDVDVDYFENQKRPAFHSWSGKKRAGVDLFSTSDYLSKRPAFHSWSGKRKRQGYGDIYEIEGKRPAFHSWSGKKRAPSSDILFSEQAKRPAFHSWSGRKRSIEGADFEAEKRPAFHSWSGKKRSDQRGLVETDKRPAFHSWSGRKRDIADAFLAELSKRPAFHSWSGKRGDGDLYSLGKRPAFHSWSGKKRSDADVLSPQLDKRPAFHSWSGRRKRDTSELDKRAAFHAWSGKKRDGNLSSAEVSKRPAFHSWSGKKRAGSDFTTKADMEKRPAFHSWSGKKRDGQGTDLSELEKRPAFHSWSGKKRSKENYEVSDMDKRPAFHSWSGKKRSGEGIDFSDMEKRPAFHSWSGKKRSEIDFLSQVADKRPAFHSWSGKKRDGAEGFSPAMDKRPAFHSWSGKKRDAPELAKRPAFHSWSGKKRSDAGALSPEIDKRPAFHSWSGKKRTSDDIFKQELEKRPSFHAWSGKKRSDAETSHGSGLDKRASFRAWSGKKRDGVDSSTSDMDKRHSFHSWSGKRDSASSFSQELNKRPAFHSWSGRKRGDSMDFPDAIFVPAIGDSQDQDVPRHASTLRGIFPDGFSSNEELSSALDHSSTANAFDFTSNNEELSKRASFHSWSGKKRSGYEPTSSESKQEALPAKRPAFHSWSGKRDSIKDSNSSTLNLPSAEKEKEPQNSKQRVDTQRDTSAEKGPPSMT